MANWRGTHWTLKQRKWLKVYLETGNGTEAAMQAYNCKDRHSASVVGANLLAKISGRVDKLMDEMGLSLPALVEKLQEGMDAQKTEFASHQGQITDHRDCIDYPTRCRYLDMALKLRGSYPADRKEIELSGVPSLAVVFEDAPNGSDDEGGAEPADSDG